MRCKICGQETLLNGRCYHGATPADELARDLQVRRLFEHMTEEDRAVLEFIFVRTLNDPKSIGAIARQWGLNGDAADFLIMRQVEEAKPRWGREFTKPDVVRASFGLNAREFLDLLQEVMHI